MFGVTAMARRARDRNIQTHRSLNRLEGTVHRRRQSQKEPRLDH